MKTQIATSAMLLLLLSGCGSLDVNSSTKVNSNTTQTKDEQNSDTDSTNDSSIIEAKLVDSPIKGVNYSCGDINGVTDKDGYFKCISLPVKFNIGKAFIGETDSIPSDGIVTLQDLSKVARDNLDDEKVAKLAVFIQSLDNDGDIDSNIEINQDIVKRLNQKVDIQDISIDEVKKILEDIGAKHLVSKDKAIKHIKEFLNINNINIDVKKDHNKKDDLLDIDVDIKNNRPDRVIPHKPNTKPTDDKNDRVKETKETPKDTKVDERPTQSKPTKKETPKDTKNNNSDNVDKTNKKDTPKTTPTPKDNGNDKVDNRESEGVKYLKIDDNLYINDKKDVVVYVDATINKNEKLIYNSKKITEITNKIYNHFSDDYDFIFLITNNKTRPKDVTYAGVFSKIKNDVKGIGVGEYDNTSKYGSNGKLKGIMHFAYRSAIVQGPTLHEISHYWANKFRNFDAKEDGSDGYHLGSGSHWGYTGFFGGKGQLGGFDAQNGGFRYENKEFNRRKGVWKLYSAKDFWWNSNGGNRIPYNDVELYLMGMLPKDRVKDLMIPIPWGNSLSPDEKAYIRDNNIVERGRTYFVAVDVVRKSWNEILSEHNIPDREPSFQNSQKEFKVLTVLLDTKMPQTNEVNIVSHQIESLAFRGDDHNPNNYNFWEATRGVGSLKVDNIQDTLETPAQEVEIGDDFESETISFRGKSYKTVKSPYTGRIWLDRNIGADRVCQDYTDEECYGYHFQFGRGYDGHQLNNSPYINQKKSSIDGNDNKYVLVLNSNSLDWLEDGIDNSLSTRLSFMNDSSGNGICPAGFRVPTMEEMKDETSSNEMGDEFPSKSINDNFLKLPFNGYRNSQSSKASITEKDTRGAYWTTTTQEYNEVTRVRHMLFNFDGIITYSTRNMAYGEGIRCIKAED